MWLVMSIWLTQPGGLPGCPLPDASPVLRTSLDLASARLTLLRCAREDLRRGAWGAADTRLAAAADAADALPRQDADAWRELVDRLRATRVVDAHAWALAPSLTAEISVPWLRDLVRHVADARLAWRDQDAPTFERLSRAARTMHERAERTGDVELARTALLVQGSVAGGQYERDEMQLVLDSARRLEQDMADALGELFVPVIVAQELEADLWLQTDRYARAAEVYRAVLARHPSRVQSWLGLAEAYRRLGYADQVREAEAVARRLAPTFTLDRTH